MLKTLSNVMTNEDGATLVEYGSSLPSSPLSRLLQ